MSTQNTPKPVRKFRSVQDTYTDFEIKQVSPAEISNHRSQILKISRGSTRSDIEPSSLHYILVQKEILIGDSKLVACVVSLYSRPLGNENAMEICYLMLDYRFLNLDGRERIKHKFLREVILRVNKALSVHTFWVKLQSSNIGEFTHLGWKLQKVGDDGNQIAVHRFGSVP